MSVLEKTTVLSRNNVRVGGAPGGVPMMFAHGFGCDQNMWRFVEPEFRDFRTILFDYVGAGGSDFSAYSRERYGSLQGYARDVVEIADELGVRGGVFVGHSVSAMIGAMAAIERPELFDKLVMIGPSPSYIDEEGYTGGFSRAQVEELLEFLDSNHMGWSQAMAPMIMGNPERPELGEELTNSFCATDPEIARNFARATFLSDNRGDLPKIPARTLVLQCSNDVIAPDAVGEYVHRAIPDSTLVRLSATGHCPNLSHPEETVEAIRAFVA